MLEKIRAKPESAKRNISFIATTIVFCGIVFVWLSSWDARIHNEKAQSSALSPFAGFTEVISGMFETVFGGTTTDSFKDNDSQASSFNGATSTFSHFDISGIVVIDNSQGIATSSVDAGN